MFYCLAAVLSVLCAEIFVFNYSSIFKSGFPVSSLDLSNIKGNPQDLMLSKDGLHVNPNSSAVSFYFDNINLPSETLTFEVSARFKSVISGKIHLKDEQFNQTFKDVYNILFAPSEKKQTVFARIKSAGNLEAAAFELYKIPGPDLTISNIRLNAAKPFNFSFLRFFLILSVVVFMIFCKFYRWNEYETDFRDKPYKISSIATLILLFYVSFLIFTALNSTSVWLNQKTSYPFNPQDKIEDPYLLVFDAFKKGQTHMDITPDEKLINLKNPYNPEERIGINYFFDYALYKNNYYVYYGIAPLLFVYYPVYYLSGVLPSMNFASFILAVFAVFAFFFAYKSFVVTFLKRVNLLLFLLGFLAIVFGSLLFVLQADVYRYEFPIISMHIFFALAAGFSFSAYNNMGSKKFIIYLALAGFSFASILMTRPNCIIIAFVFLVPLYLSVLSDKNISRHLKINGAAAFLIPCIVILSFVFLYNYARFDSPFNFGQNYNLTSTNPAISTYQKLSASNFFTSIYYYFFDIPKLSAHFPFISTERYFYNLTGSAFPARAETKNIGVFAFPFFWALFIWFKNFKTQNKDKLFKIILISTVAVSLAAAFIGFAFGYPGFRYICDISPALALLSGLIMLACAQNFKQDANSKILYSFFTLACAVTIILGALMIFNGEMMWIYKIAPQIYAKWFNLFYF
ncbi:MAG: hypothetical protein FWH43_01305 [Endomicrobia bacterium]|nr:hypothetical protein [Endomicrobiia bacterium]